MKIRRHHNNKGLRQIQRGRTREWAERMEEKMKTQTCKQCGSIVYEDRYHPGFPCTHVCPPKEPVRSEVVEFSEAMERKLLMNDWKEPWQKMPVDDLYDRLEDEFHELGASMDKPDDAKEELLDIASFAMMLWHRLSDE